MFGEKLAMAIREAYDEMFVDDLEKQAEAFGRELARVEWAKESGVVGLAKGVYNVFNKGMKSGLTRPAAELFPAAAKAGVEPGIGAGLRNAATTVRAYAKNNPGKALLGAAGVGAVGALGARKLLSDDRPQGY